MDQKGQEPFSNLPGVTQLESNKAGVWTQAVGIQKRLVLLLQSFKVATQSPWRNAYQTWMDSPRSYRKTPRYALAHPTLHLLYLRLSNILTSTLYSVLLIVFETHKDGIIIFCAWLLPFNTAFIKLSHVCMFGIHLLFCYLLFRGMNM